MQKKTKDMTPEEANKAFIEMRKDHRRRMETDPEYRMQIEEAAKRKEKMLYPGAQAKKD